MERNAEVATKPATTKVVATIDPVATSATTKPIVATKHGSYADADKRREYMRAYAAKRRASKVPA